MNLKIFFLAISLFSFSSWADANNFGEAQIIGKVSQVTKIVDGCNVKIGTFSYYHASVVRPIFPGEVLEQEIFLSIRQCAGLSVGDEISGVLVLNENGLALED